MRTRQAPGGIEATIAGMQAAMQRFRIEQGFEPEETVVTGDWAFERGIETMRVTPRDGSPPRTLSQRTVVILRRGSDGRWRYARGMTNGLPESTA